MMLKDVTIAMHFDKCHASAEKSEGSKCFISSLKKKVCAQNYRYGTLQALPRLASSPLWALWAEPNFNISKNEVEMSDEMMRMRA